MRESSNPVNEYLETLLPPLSSALRNIEARLRRDDKWGINIGSVEGRFLQFLIRSHSFKAILEIGTQYGYSTQWMLESLPPEGRVTTIEKNEEHYRCARELITDSRVDWHLGDAREILTSFLPNKKFDLIFIDANKKAYPDYLTAADQLLTSGGWLVADNTFLFGQVFQNQPPAEAGLWQAMRHFNQQVFSHPDYESCIIPTGEGLTVARKK